MKHLDIFNESAWQHKQSHFHCKNSSPASIGSSLWVQVAQSQPNRWSFNRVTWPKAARYKQVTVVSEIFTLSWTDFFTNKNTMPWDFPGWLFFWGGMFRDLSFHGLTYMVELTSATWEVFHLGGFFCLWRSLMYFPNLICTYRIK